MGNGNYEQTHEKLVKSGLEAFLKEGYEKANLRRICKAAGITTGAFYKHFEDKEALFSELVEPLARKIRQTYVLFETRGYEEYGDVRPLSRQRLASVLEMKEQGTLETSVFLYSHRDIYELLVFRSYGTPYEHFLDALIDAEDKNTFNILEMIHGKENALTIMTKESIHIVNQAFFKALSENVVHAKSKEELLATAKVISAFFNAGWERYRNP